MAAYQVSSEMQTPTQLMQREPLLRAGLQGGLWVPGDGIVYAPEVARWFIADAGDNLTCLSEGATEIAEPAVTLTSGKRRGRRLSLSPRPRRQWAAGETGCGQERSAGDHRPLRPVTPSSAGRTGYGASAHGGGTSGAFNVQPAPHRTAADRLFAAV